MQLELNGRALTVEKLSQDGCYSVREQKTLTSLGWVRRQRGFSYRGVDGWNRGIRLRDFHPTEWIACDGHRTGLKRRTRLEAILDLIRMQEGKW